MHAGAGVFRELPALREHALRQSAVMTREQLARYDVDSKAVAGQVQAWRWAAIGPLLVVMHRGPLTRSARLWAAVLNAGKDAALCSWTSLDQWGLRGWERPDVHVVVPRGQTPTPLPWVRLHESRRHTAADIVTPRGRPPAHDVPRAAVDAASWEPVLRSGCGLLAATVQQRLTRPDDLFLALDTAGRIRHRRVLMATVHDIAGGAQALSEIDFITLCTRAGLPLPVQQSERLDVHGRRRFRDVEWRRADGRTVIGEIDGMGHLDASRWYDDLLRDAELLPVEADAIRFRIPALAVRTEPQRVVALVRRVLLV